MPLSNGENKGTDDSDMSLRTIASSTPQMPLINRLIRIQRQHQLDQDKSIEFVTNLQCLQFRRDRSRKRSLDGEPSGPLGLMRRSVIDGSKGEFVAVSWTWDPAKGFESGEPKGGFRVEESGLVEPTPSGVRDSILLRVREYMSYRNLMDQRDRNVDHFWIDKHCIEQTPGPEKEEGMQAMDLVYGKSKYPIALLARPVQSSGELELLAQICRGHLVDAESGRFVLAGTSRQTALAAMQLLKDITDDLWWTRGWTYQENYRAFLKMVLLVPHDPALNRRKDKRLFGSLSGQLCIPSQDFHARATKFCLAFHAQYYGPGDQRLYDSVMLRTKSYRTLSDEQIALGQVASPQAMSPIIFGDVIQRDLTRVWDRIPIIANCCYYTALLDSEGLEEAGESLSLSILALYLMNGEILANHLKDHADVERTRELTAVAFIQSQSYQWFRSISLEGGRSRNLCFIKGCRFLPTLMIEGILTKGHLWAIEKLVRSEDLRPQRHRRRGTLESQLDYIADRLRDIGEDWIASQLDLVTAKKPKTFSQNWKAWMAENLVSALNGGRDLKVGIARLVNPKRPDRDNGALFVMEEEEDSSVPDLLSELFSHGSSDNESSVSGHSETDSEEESSSEESAESESISVEELEEEEQTLVFTSFRERESDWAAELNDLDRYVSMAVTCDDVGSRTPRLRTTKKWIWGLNFFPGQPLQDVMFPWPEALRGL